MYRYFGAAKDLPGVKELLEKQQEKYQAMRMKKRSPTEIYKRIDDRYFGWRDEEDGVLLELENNAFEEYLDELKSKRRKMDLNDNVKVVDLDKLAYENDYFKDVPTQEEMKKMLFEEKKKTLLAKFSK